jgi:hypothetical protein
MPLKILIADDYTVFRDFLKGCVANRRMPTVKTRILSAVGLHEARAIYAPLLVRMLGPDQNLDLVEASYQDAAAAVSSHLPYVILTNPRGYREPSDGSTIAQQLRVLSPQPTPQLSDMVSSIAVGES